MPSTFPAPQITIASLQITTICWPPRVATVYSSLFSRYSLSLISRNKRDSTMPLSDTSTASRLQITIASLPNQVVRSSNFKIVKFGNVRCLNISEARACKNHNFVIHSFAEDSTSPVGVDVSFPSDYSNLLLQAKKATALALEDGKQLMEIEFPTAGLESVPGDGEGGIEMTGSMQLIREFCDCFINPEKASRTRIFFPEASEVEFARKSAFGGASFKLDYLTKPSIFEDFGFVSKVKMADRVKPEDELFLVAYPYFNVNEMLVVEELYREAVENTSRKLIIFNGEIDRIRTGYYPPFFYPKLAALAKTFLPKMEIVYYIHNFKGQNGGTLFRCYPGSWKVLRKVNKKYICLHEQEEMPSLKEVALEILPSA